MFLQVPMEATLHICFPDVEHKHTFKSESLFQNHYHHPQNNNAEPFLNTITIFKKVLKSISSLNSYKGYVRWVILFPFYRWEWKHQGME